MYSVCRFLFVLCVGSFVCLFDYWWVAAGWVFGVLACFVLGFRSLGCLFVFRGGWFVFAAMWLIWFVGDAAVC